MGAVETYMSDFEENPFDEIEETGVESSLPADPSPLDVLGEILAELKLNPQLILDAVEDAAGKVVDIAEIGVKSISVALKMFADVEAILNGVSSRDLREENADRLIAARKIAGKFGANLRD